MNDHLLNGPDFILPIFEVLVTSASREVKNIRSVEAQRHLTDQGVDWRFIVDRAHLVGGFWERMVRTVKGVLKKVIGRSNLNYDELLTILTEVKSIVNDRPITCVYHDVEAMPYALSPSQLVYGRRLANMPNSSHFESVTTCSSLTRPAYRRFLKHFVNRWR